MKTMIALTVSFVAIVLFAADTPLQTGQIGRYQLIAAEYDFTYVSDSVGASRGATKSVFRIDTQTGRVWVFFAGRNKEGKSFMNMTPIQELKANDNP